VLRSAGFQWLAPAAMMQAAAQQAQLQETLAKLDAASAKFQSAEANVHRDAYTAFIKETVGSDGITYFKREPDGKMELGYKTSGPQARTIVYKDGVVRAYNPSANCTDTITNKSIDTFLAIGFGGSGKDLAKAWDISDLGPETIAGTKVEKLDLTPKDAAARQNVAKVTVWVDLDRDVSLKQIIYSPNKDTNTAIYSDIRLNKPVNTKPYEIKGKACGK
jgi:outer membrane lipoprotein-sorting protein